MFLMGDEKIMFEVSSVKLVSGVGITQSDVEGKELFWFTI